MAYMPASQREEHLHPVIGLRTHETQRFAGEAARDQCVEGRKAAQITQAPSSRVDARATEVTGTRKTMRGVRTNLQSWCTMVTPGEERRG
jgi:hypothetical protein